CNSIKDSHSEEWRIGELHLSHFLDLIDDKNLCPNKKEEGFHQFLWLYFSYPECMVWKNP
ncbi:MAG: hypothetical protein ACK559_13740, partial [bacterium]